MDVLKCLIEGTQITFKIDFANAYGTMGAYSFQSFSSKPMSYTITIIPGVIRFNGDNNNLFIQSWNPSNPFTDNTPLTVREEGLEPYFLGYHFEDVNNNEIPKSKLKPNQNITLVIQTENAEGDTITIDLDDDNLDYKHNGMVLENDVLSGISITSDETRIALKVVKQN